MNDSGLVYRVVDWDGRHETARSLKKSGPRAEVSVSSDLGGGALARLLALPDSATLLGVWYFIQALAANCERRGALTRFGAPLTVEELARLSGWDLPLIERTLKTLCDPEVGLLEQVPRHEARRSSRHRHRESLESPSRRRLPTARFATPIWWNWPKTPTLAAWATWRTRPAFANWLKSAS